METKAPFEPEVLTVTQLSLSIKQCLERSFPIVALQGELSNFKPHSSGHLYFSIKDANSQIQAVMFRPDAARLQVLPKDGTQVIVKGEVNVYPPAGRYQILVKEMRPIGVGELLLKLEELKKQILARGWFKSDRKKPIPKFPKCIGVVTSPTGAAIHDILNVLTRRFSGFHLILNPVKVQGEGAAQEIAKAIQEFNKYNLCDVMIVGRGGGSIEDLWAFNEEIVAEAIFNSHIPIISAVGHETDHCIADYVADIRAPTPSAAAEIVVAEKGHHLQHLEQLRRRMQQTLFQLIRHDKQRLQGITKSPYISSPYGILGPWVQRLDELKADIELAIKQKITGYQQELKARAQVLLSLRPGTRLEHYRQKLGGYSQRIDESLLIRCSRLKDKIDQSSKQLDRSVLQQIRNNREKLLHMQNILDKVNPKTLLGRGYCILFSEKRKSTITSVHSVEKNDDIKVLVSDGSIDAIVTKVIPTKEKSPK